MTLLLAYSFLSGLLTIFAPCIWPLLPIVLSSTVTGGSKKPLALSLGLVTSFGISIVSISFLVRAFSFDPNSLRILSVLIIIVLGITLIVPSLTQRLEGTISRMLNKVNTIKPNSSTGARSGFITGVSLGLIWTPCAGPILASIIAIIATQQLNVTVIFMILSYLLGVAIPMFIFATFGTKVFAQTSKLGKYTHKIQQIFGIIMILTALAIYTNFDKTLQAKLLDIFPWYSQALYKIEGSKRLEEVLDKVTNDNENTRLNYEDKGQNSFKPAPEFENISNWLNVDKPLIQKELRGKVVLIDFWTYTCINCIRTLPHVTNWYQKYKDKGFVVVGVHTPEFEFEKETDNVIDAIKEYNISYPVAQDNEYKTWYAYNNRYWPAHYLIDANGYIRYEHFGEGKYEETEAEIVKLLKEAGQTIDFSKSQIQDTTPKLRQTPETYLGINRIENFGSNEEATLGISKYTMPKSIPVNYFAYEGLWKLTPEYAESAEPNVNLKINFFANKVFLVITPKVTGQKIKVTLDGENLTSDIAGKDVVNSEIHLDTDRLYEIINIQGSKRSHELLLELNDKEIRVYAFTFGS